MSKKGADTQHESVASTQPDNEFSKPPKWHQALLKPEQLNDFRRNMISVHRSELRQAVARATQALHDGQTSTSEKSINFELKQMLGKLEIEGCDIYPSALEQGKELEWIRKMLAIDAKDPNIEHNNRNEIMSEASRNETTVTQLIIDETKDQVAKPKADVDSKFIEQIVADLYNSPSKSLMVKLTDSKNNQNALALVILKGENGIIVHDAKYQRDFNFKPEKGKDQTAQHQTLIKFLEKHLEKNHADCKKGSIVQVLNKGLTSENKQTLDSSQTRKRALTKGLENTVEKQHHDRIKPETPSVQAHSNLSENNKKRRKTDPPSPGKGFKK